MQLAGTGKAITSGGYSGSDIVDLCKRAASSNALIILRGVSAYNLRLFHFNPKDFLYEVNGGENRKIGVPFAAAWAADLPNCTQ